MVKLHRPASNLLFPAILLSLGIWLIFNVGIMLLVALNGGPNTRAVMGMATSLVLIWVVGCGGLMVGFRRQIQTWIQSIPGRWQIKFVLFATLAALLEEAITTALTNLAPMFGVPIGSAYITASTNYLDVVCLHSVVVFIPMFVAWAFLLGRYDFQPVEVFVLFGVNGLIGEVMFGGFQALAQGGFWVFIYGLMVYLPASSLPSDRLYSLGKAQARPRWFHYVLAAWLPIIFAIPVALIIGAIHPVRIHFPDIPPNS